MQKPNIRKYISFIVIILAVVLVIFLVLKGKKADAPIVDNTEVKDNVTNPRDTTKPITDTKPSNLTEAQKVLLTELQASVNARDFGTFADLLQKVYKNQWTQKEFVKVESDMYVYATDTYWVKGDLANSLRFSTLVFNKVPEAWRFRYLRIVTLEKYGRNALNAGDLKTAENYANQILQMMYRPEGANLLADIYISKINTNIKDGNTTLAKQNYAYIKDYEVSQDRRDTLNNLKKQLGL
jgi:hypothetical protein